MREKLTNSSLSKKILLLCLCLCCLSSCSQEPEELPPEVSTLPQVGEYYNMVPTGKAFPALDGIPVDMDFTAMSTTVSFSMSQMMMYQPEDFWDKTYRIQGMYLYQFIEEFGDVHVLMLMDETNCCFGFIEFFLPDGVEYPPNGAEFAVIGEYIYVNDPIMPYSTLAVSQIAF